MGSADPKKFKYCPFLRGDYIFSCKADINTYIPSFFELHEYCESSRHMICSHYMHQRFEDLYITPSKKKYACAG